MKGLVLTAVTFVALFNLTTPGSQAQTNNPISATVNGGLTTNKMSTPGLVTVLPVCTGTCVTPWTYYVAAVDAGGGTTLTS
jgi:hypothetical protein